MINTQSPSARIGAPAYPAYSILISKNFIVFIKGYAVVFFKHRIYLFAIVVHGVLRFECAILGRGEC